MRVACPKRRNRITPLMGSSTLLHYIRDPNHIESHPAARVDVVGMQHPPDNQRCPTLLFPCAERHAALQPMWQPGASQCRHRRSGRRSTATTAAAEVQQGGRKEAGPMVSRSRQLSALIFLAPAAAGACEQLRTTAAKRHSFRPHIECAMCTSLAIGCTAPGGTGAVSSSICRLQLHFCGNFGSCWVGGC